MYGILHSIVQPLYREPVSYSGKLYIGALYIEDMDEFFTNFTASLS